MYNSYSNHQWVPPPSRFYDEEMPDYEAMQEAAERNQNEGSEEPDPDLEELMRMRIHRAFGPRTRDEDTPYGLDIYDFPRY